MEIVTGSSLIKPPGNLPAQEITICVKQSLLPFFYQLLGQGFIVNAPANSSIRNLITECLGISEIYLEERIQTLFLNGTVVDDLDSSITQEGSTLALSGAMPGLAGAVLRRGGFYASFRRQISHSDSKSYVEKGDLWIVVKLFNLVVRELGPAFLERGIWLIGEKLQKFLSRHLEELELHATTSQLNDNSIDLSNLLRTDWKNHLVFLRVKPE